MCDKRATRQTYFLDSEKLFCVTMESHSSILRKKRKKYANEFVAAFAVQGLTETWATRRNMERQIDSHAQYTADSELVAPTRKVFETINRSDRYRPEGKLMSHRQHGWGKQASARETNEGNKWVHGKQMRVTSECTGNKWGKQASARETNEGNKGCTGNKWGKQVSARETNEGSRRVHGKQMRETKGARETNEGNKWVHGKQMREAGECTGNKWGKQRVHGKQMRETSECTGNKWGKQRHTKAGVLSGYKRDTSSFDVRDIGCKGKLLERMSKI